jgi:hypothetical protein
MNAGAERIYQLLLQAYPPEFRAEYGREMALLFRDLCGEGEVRSLRFWAGIISDVARSAPALRAEAWRARGMRRTHTIEVLMKVAALLTVLLGLFVTLNAAGEGLAGRGSMAETHVLAVALGALAGALLLTAGVTLLRSAPSARRAATAAALASLVFILVARLLHPWMSIFSQLVGIAMPVTLLIVLHWRRRSASSAG